MPRKGKRPRKSPTESALFIWSRCVWKPSLIGERRLKERGKVHGNLNPTKN
jgi:hypothetical protein